MEDFLLGFIADGARVVQHQPSLLDAVDLAISLRHERPDYFFRIVHIHLATKSLQIKSLFREAGLFCGRHLKISITVEDCGRGASRTPGEERGQNLLGLIRQW